MIRFVTKQRWIMEGADLRAAVVKASDGGRNGVVAIFDSEFRRVGTYSGTVVHFLQLGKWEVKPVTKR
jgi:hypothetical protein